MKLLNTLLSQGLCIGYSLFLKHCPLDNPSLHFLTSLLTGHLISEALTNQLTKNCNSLLHLGLLKIKFINTWNTICYICLLFLSRLECKLHEGKDLVLLPAVFFRFKMVFYPIIFMFIQRRYSINICWINSCIKIIMGTSGIKDGSTPQKRKL